MQKNYLNLNLLFGLLFFTKSLIVYCQQTNNDSIRVMKENLAENLLKKGKYISASQELKEALMYIPSEDKEQRMLMLYKIGESYRLSVDVDSAKYFYDKAELFYNDSLSDFLKSYRYHTKASIYHGTFKIDSTVSYAIKSLDHALLSKNMQRIFNSHMSLGQIFLSQNSLDKANFYFDKALQMAKKTNDNFAFNFALTYKAGVEVEKQNYNLAEEYLQKVIPYFEKNNNLKQVFTSKGFLSKAYLSMGKMDKSVQVSFELLPIINQMEFRDNVNRMVFNTNILASLATKNATIRDTVNDAEKLVKDAMKTYKYPLAKIQTGKALAIYYKNNELASDYKNSYNEKVTLGNELQENIKVLDSFYQNSLNAKYTELETKYQTEKKEKENLQLQQLNTQQQLDLEQENRRKWFFGIGLLGSLLTLSIFLFFYRRNKKQKNIIEKLQRELHHRMKNNLAIIDTFIDTAKDELKDTSGKQKLTELQNRIDSIFKVHQLLYNSNKDITRLSAQIYIDTLVTGVKNSFSNRGVAITTDIDPNTTFSTEKTFPVGLIVNEFLTNSYKHAFNSDKDAHINISVSEQKEKYVLELSDNGKGLPKNFDINDLDTFGMDVFKLLCKQLKGTFMIDGEDGVSLYITFPKI